MKQIRLLLPLCILTLSLTSCNIIFGDDSWKEEYGTPELFLEQVKDFDGFHYEKIFMYKEGNGVHDNDFVVKNAILESGPFEQIKKREATVKRYFTYQAYWQAATSGPNYCDMSIWDDGLIRIDHKNSLGPHGYLYFEIDGEKAVTINDLVFSILSNQPEE